MDPNNSRSTKQIVLGAGAVILLCGGFFFLSDIRAWVRETFSLHDSTELLQTIRAELVQSGRLIFSGGSANAWLTDTGTFSLTNNERALRNLPVFSASETLDRIARARLLDMFEGQYFDHVSPQGHSASTEAERFGYEYISIGENIALGNFDDDATLVKAWMDSPGHKENIVSSKFSELGVAVGKGVYEGRETWIAVQIFARPLDECAQVNEALKVRINDLSSRIDRNTEELNRMKQELDRGSGDQEEHREKVETYNALVSETNALIKTVKADVETYNRGVRSFNACLERFS